MSTVYNSAKICSYSKPECDLDKEGLTLDPEIELLLDSSRDYDELEWTWSQWHAKTGPFMREDYKEYVSLLNEAAVANGFENAGKMWQSRYEMEEFEELAEKLWNEVEPLYEDLHTYVKYKLQDMYKGKFDPESPYIPAHILGNMWAQTWDSLYEDLKPFKDASMVDVTGSMASNGYDIPKMFDDSNEFYLSMGLEDSLMSYTGKSIVEKPEDRIIACHASAWDFCDGEDFRIKMCTKITQGDYETVHHEMGHIQYFLLYKGLPLPFRTGANPGFHEAVGDAISLSVGNPHHLKAIGLLDNYADSYEDNINALFSMALERVAFLPFGYLIDKWRWGVFDGSIEETEWNKQWWELRRKYQKITEPEGERGESFFDPGAKYHVPADSQYMSYFVARILQFQFYKALCIEADQYNPENPSEKPLHKCDFYQSTKAGDKFRAGLELGLSKHWEDALEELIGSKEMSADALLEYFSPLRTFLQAEIAKITNDDQIRSVLSTYDEEATDFCNSLVTAEWNQVTDVNSDEKKQLLQDAILENAAFVKDQFEAHFSAVNMDDYLSDDVKRQLRILSKLGKNILDEDKLKDLTETQTRMETVYNNGRICPYSKQDCDLTSDDALTLNPDIEEVLASSEDFDELKYVWAEWHEQTGKKMRSDYENYVGLVAEVANLNGYEDYGKLWQAKYEDDNFVENMEKLWAEVEPLYDELHTFVRHSLIDLYGDKLDEDSELITAHLLGNMWAQSWVNLYERIKPFQTSNLVDVSETMVAQGYNASTMFEESNRFYLSLGLEDSTMSFTGDSIIEKPEDTVIACHASAWDFCDGSDFRIKQCTKVNMEDFVTAHHEMGHIQYYILYKEQPLIYRDGANPGFHEAVGDLIALSVSTPKHLAKINLLENYEDNYENSINALFKMALERVAFLPFGILIDQWRWRVFKGEISTENWNEQWWAMREKYQKVSSPTGPRGEEFFDPGAKFHVPSDYSYIAYFVAHILEFQMHKSLCILAGEYDPENKEELPLYNCDIFESEAAGKKIRAGLELGSSQHWSKALQMITGEKDISGAALREYFEPLYEYLKERNAEWKKAEDESNLVPIIVGSVIGGLLVCALGGYGYYTYRKKRASAA